MENAKVEKFKCGIFSNFQTMYIFILDSKIHISFPFQWMKVHFESNGYTAASVSLTSFFLFYVSNKREVQQQFP